MAHTKKGSVNSRFQVGDKVRVQRGVNDPLFPDMPLGGWAGTVTEIIKGQGQINCVQVGRSNSSEYPPDLPQAM
jgi:hypothetical protein